VYAAYGRIKEMWRGQFYQKLLIFISLERNGLKGFFKRNGLKGFSVKYKKSLLSTLIDVKGGKI
jgi:hypothetical protein